MTNISLKNDKSIYYSRPIVLNNNKPHPQRGIITKIIKYSNQPLKALIASQTANIYQQHPLILNEYHSKPTAKPFYMLPPNKHFNYMEIDKSADFALVTHSSNTNTNTNSNNSVIDSSNSALKVCCNNNFVLLNSPINSFRNKTHNIYTNSSQSVLLSPYTVNSAEHSPPIKQIKTNNVNKSKHLLTNKNKCGDTYLHGHVRSTPCTNKTKSKINWNKLSKFILNQPSGSNNCIKKITLEQIAKNKKKGIIIDNKHVHVKKHYLKKQNRICNIKKQIHKPQSVFSDKNFTENNVTSSTMSLITKTNVSGYHDNSLCNIKHKHCVSPTDNKAYNNKTSMLIRANLIGNRSDLCLKHSTIVTNLFKNK